MEEFEYPTYDHIVLANQRLIVRYGGLGHHVREGGSLSYALGAIQHPIYGVDQFPTLVEKACKLAYAIANGHVFADKNKSTAMSALDLMFELNGHVLRAGEDELATVMYRVADSVNGISFEDFVAWVADRVVRDTHR